MSAQNRPFITDHSKQSTFITDPFITDPFVTDHSKQSTFIADPFITDCSCLGPDGAKDVGQNGLVF